MAAVETQAPPTEPAPAIPDYLASPNAVLGDGEAQWRYGKAPDYSKTRQVWEETKQANHAAGSLPQLVENLVKNWEVEASFKSRLSDWRTVDHEKYSFAINGGPPQTGEHMLKVGTYNAIIAANEYYSPENSDFASSHKTFKRMMPTFAWEVLEVYSGPPTVAFKWRHWGTMKNDYVGFNNKGEKVTAKAHGGVIDITGITVATVDDKVRLQEVNTYFDPMEMFRQIAPEGIVNKQIIDHHANKESALDDQPSNDGVKIAEAHNTPGTEHSKDAAPSKSGGPAVSKSRPSTNGHAAAVQGARDVVDTAKEQGSAPTVESTPANAANGTKTGPAVQQSDVVNAVSAASQVTEKKVDHSKASSTHDEVDAHLEQSAQTVHPHPKDVENAVQPTAGEAVVAPANTEETRMTHEEMSRITPAECPFMMNRE